MNTQTTFTTLAATAKRASAELAVTYRVDAMENGKLTPVGDTWATLEQAANDLVESLEYHALDDLTCWEISADGMATDVTDRAKYIVEMWCEARGDLAPWEEASGDEAEHDFQRGEAALAGVFS